VAAALRYRVANHVVETLGPLALARGAERVFTRSHLFDIAWPANAALAIDERTVDIHVRRLRVNSDRTPNGFKQFTASAISSMIALSCGLKATVWSALLSRLWPLNDYLSVRPLWYNGHGGPLMLSSTNQRTNVDEVLRFPSTRVVADLVTVLGAPLTALIGGASETRAVRRWIDGAAAPRRDDRLRFALQVATILSATEAPAVVRAWFGGMNTRLHDETPALLIAERPLDEIRRPVVDAARSFIAP